ncbi:uncharacterized protein LOC132060747 [Lycium ferocissimum]|uniref:uncharacterized protein LOC132060747 n=1 Tax=Lycium ferocissimum TaxID=112874 RepID=UPI0028169585|nr:uncharacterized protein LOC132060747 [Lycium ferocissimum]XP_059309675.1 uncharacterized protein LOC132060747 [Lycium ferocissimum]
MSWTKLRVCIVESDQLRIRWQEESLHSYSIQISILKEKNKRLKLKGNNDLTDEDRKELKEMKENIHDLGQQRYVASTKAKQSLKELKAMEEEIRFAVDHLGKEIFLKMSGIEDIIAVGWIKKKAKETNLIITLGTSFKQANIALLDRLAVDLLGMKRGDLKVDAAYRLIKGEFKKIDEATARKAGFDHALYDNEGVEEVSEEEESDSPNDD